jgi:hypothetical protein
MYHEISQLIRSSHREFAPVSHDVLRSSFFSAQQSNSAEEREGGGER